VREGEQFLRIRVQSGDQDGSTRVVLWRGQREEIYQDGKIPHNCDLIVAWLIGDLVDVTRWQPRLSILPLWLPGIASKMTTCVVEVTCTGVTQLRLHRQIYPDINTCITFTQRSSPSPTRWGRIDGRRTLPSRRYQFSRGRHRNWVKGEESAITKSTTQIRKQNLARHNDRSTWRVRDVGSV